MNLPHKKAGPLLLIHFFDFLQDGLQARLKLPLAPRFALGFHVLGVVGERAAVKIRGFQKQVGV